VRGDGADPRAKVGWAHAPGLRSGRVLWLLSARRAGRHAKDRLLAVVAPPLAPGEQIEEHW